MFSVTNIDVKIRCLVLLQDAHFPRANIAWTLNKPERTIKDWMTKIQKGIDFTKVEEGRGKTRKISKETEEKIVRMTKRRGFNSSTNTLERHKMQVRDQLIKYCKNVDVLIQN